MRIKFLPLIKPLWENWEHLEATGASEKIIEDEMALTSEFFNPKGRRSDDLAAMPALCVIYFFLGTKQLRRKSKTIGDQTISTHVQSNVV